MNSSVGYFRKYIFHNLLTCVHLKYMYIFGKVLDWNILCSLNVYLTVVISDHFHFVFFRYRCENVVEILLNLWKMLIEFLCVIVSELWEMFLQMGRDSSCENLKCENNGVSFTNIVMDWSWMNARHLNENYEQGLVCYCNILKNTRDMWMR